MSRRAELRELAAAEAAERMAARQLDAELDAARAQAQDAQGALVRAHAEGRHVTRTHKQRDTARDRLEDLLVRRDAARLRVGHAAAAVEAFEVAHARELIEEYAPDAERAIEEMRAATESLLAADREWHALAQRVGQLLGRIPHASARRDTHAEHALAQPARELKRALASEGIASPLPHWAGVELQERNSKATRLLRLRRLARPTAGEQVEMSRLEAELQVRDTPDIARTPVA